MAETLAIEWCDATVNFWWGCTKVSPGCDHCYAETLNAFRGSGEWGLNAPRRKIKGAVSLLRMLNRKSALTFFNEHNRSIRVFMQSMSDTFDNEVSDEWRAELFAEAKEARWVKIILLTKRGANVPKMVPPAWLDAWPKQIGLMFSITNQREADRDIPRLIDLKKRFGLPWIGLSLEPLLGRVRLKAEWLDNIDWVIVGGESGTDARPMHPHWLDDIKNACTLRQHPPQAGTAPVQAMGGMGASRGRTQAYARKDRGRLPGSGSAERQQSIFSHQPRHRHHGPRWQEGCRSRNVWHRVGSMSESIFVTDRKRLRGASKFAIYTLRLLSP